MDIKETSRKVIGQFRAGGPVEGMERSRLPHTGDAARVRVADPAHHPSRPYPLAPSLR
jgi:hypothetical protein